MNRLPLILTVLMTLWAASSFARVSHAEPIPCRSARTTPYKIKGQILSVTSYNSYVSMQIKAKSKKNLCTGDKQFMAPGTIEVVTFGGDAQFKDKYRYARTPAQLYPTDNIVAVGYEGPVVYPAACTDRNKCFKRGLVLYQPSHRLARRR